MWDRLLLPFKDNWFTTWKFYSILKHRYLVCICNKSCLYPAKGQSLNIWRGERHLSMFLCPKKTQRQSDIRQNRQLGTLWLSGLKLEKDNNKSIVNHTHIILYLKDTLLDWSNGLKIVFVFYRLTGGNSSGCKRFLQTLCKMPSLLTSVNAFLMSSCS